MTAIQVRAPGRLRIAEEPNGSFEVDQSAGSLNNFKDCPIINGFELTLEQPTETPGHVEQHIDAHAIQVLMPKTSSMKLPLRLETLDTKAGNGSTAAQSALGLLLKIFMGGERLGTGTTVASTSSTTVINCTSAAGILPGTAIACATGAGGTMEMREVKSVSSNAVTVKYAFSSAPANASTVLSCATYYLGGTSGDLTTSLQAVWEGLSVQDRYVLRGGQLKSMSFGDMAPATMPTINLDTMLTKWDYANGTDDGGGTIADRSAAALGLATYTNVRTQVVFNSEFRVFTVGSSSITNTLLHAPKFDFKPNLKYTAHRTPSTRSTYKQWIRDRNDPAISGSFSVPEQDKTWLTALQNQTALSAALQIGSDITKGGVFITAPTIQITSVQRANIDGIHGIEVQYVGRLDEDTSGSTTDLAKSAFRIHLF